MESKDCYYCHLPVTSVDAVFYLIGTGSVPVCIACDDKVLTSD